MMHAALDRLEEILGPVKSNNYTRFSRGTQWMGSICPMEECEIYGFATASDIKILALLKRDTIIQLKKRRESDIKALFVRAFRSLHFVCHYDHLMLTFFFFVSLQPSLDQCLRFLRQAYNESLHETTFQS